MKKIELTKGRFTWVDDEDYDSLGKHPWHINTRGYAARTIHNKGNQKNIRMHREIMNTPVGMQTDHINHDKLDNRRSNLRICTNGQNQQNGKKCRTYGGKTPSSKYKGVSFNKRKNKWASNIVINKEMIFLGYYSDETQAAHTYDQAAHEMFGEFARLNFK